MKLLLNGFKIAILVTSFILIAAKGPELHANYIRTHVGMKTVYVRGMQGGGSGFFVKAPSGITYIMTNKHICELADEEGNLFVQKEEDDRIYDRKIVAIYEHHDLCLVESIGNVKGVSVSESLSIGETIGLIGHPKLQPLTLSKGEFIGHTTIKIVTAIDPKEGECKGDIVEVKDILSLLFFRSRKLCVSEFYTAQITAYSRGGSSGSPVVNFFGNLVGVLFAGNRMDPFQSFMVPLEDVQDFLKDY
jgi:S1-C subfamily serine protease